MLGDPKPGMPQAADNGSSQNEIACPEKLLLLAVLERAVRDLDYHGVEPKDRRSAIFWFRAKPPAKHKRNRRWRSITWHDVKALCQFTQTQLDYIEEQVRCAETGYTIYKENYDESSKTLREKKSIRARKSSQNKRQSSGAGVVPPADRKRRRFRVTHGTAQRKRRGTSRCEVPEAFMLPLRGQSRRSA